jgi:hypothetical protein
MVSMFKFKDRIMYILKKFFREAFKIELSAIEAKIYEMKEECALLFHN